MSKQAQLADGTILEFPDDTADAVIDRVVKQHIQSAPKVVEPSFLDKAKATFSAGLDVARAANMPVDATIGAAKEFGSTAWQLGKRLQGTNPVPPIGPANGRTPLNQPMIQLADKKPDYLEPSNTLQKVGAGAATMAEYAAPSMAASKIPALANMGLAGQSILQAALSGGVSTARGATPTQALTDAATAGVTTGVIGGAAKLAKPLGERIELAILKPVKSDLQGIKGPPEIAPQTMVKNLFKYDLGGTLDQSYTKATAKTAELGSQLRQALASNPAAQVDMNQILADTARELGGASTKNFGTNAAIKKSLAAMADEVNTVSQTGHVNLADAQDIKQALGTMGSWVSGMRDADSTATETVANTMYTKLRLAIEQASGQSQQVQDINRQFGEVIPIKNAILRRIPVAARREPVSLKEAIYIATGNVKGIGLAVADRAMRSGTMANALVKAGENPAAVGAAAAPLVTGATNAASDALQRYRRNPPQ